MPRLKNKKPGRRVNVWIDGAHLEIWEKIENGSGFLQIALDDAVGIMTWALLKKQQPERYNLEERPFEEVAEEFNQAFPVDPLTAKRLNKQKWQENSQKKQELW